MSESHGVPGPPPSPPPTTGPFYGPIQRYGHPPADHPADDAAHPAAAGPPPAWPPAAPLAPPPVTLPSYAPWAPVAPVPGSWAPVPPWSPPGPWPSPRRTDYASWARRVAGAVVDAVPGWVAGVVLVAGYLPTYAGFFRGDLTVAPHYPLVVVGTLLSLAASGWAVYNRWFLAGRTGQSIGKRVAKTWLVGQASGRPVGPLDAFLRDLLHTLDGIGYVGYLWPLWDDERQTLADKIAQTVVVRTPVPPLAPPGRRPG